MKPSFGKEVWNPAQAPFRIGLETHVWRMTIPATTRPRTSLLDSQERARTLAFKRSSHAAAFAFVRSAVRLILAEYLACDPKQVRIVSRCEHCGGNHGKPRTEGLEFNVSHSTELAVVAVTERSPIGVDIESRARPLTPLDVRMILGEREQSSEIVSDPLRVWTTKEAYLKATGVGLTGYDRNLQVGEIERKASVVQFDADDSHIGSLAVLGPIGGLAWFHFEMDALH